MKKLFAAAAIGALVAASSALAQTPSQPAPPTPSTPPSTTTSPGSTATPDRTQTPSTGSPSGDTATSSSSAASPNAGAGHAMAMSFDDVDANKDGKITKAELAKAKVKVSAAMFAKYDADNNKSLSQDEFDAWQKASSTMKKTGAKAGSSASTHDATTPH